MSKLNVLLALIATISLLAACNGPSNEDGDVTLIDASKVTEIRVQVLNIKISGNELFRTISTPTEIGSLTSFANENVLAKSNLKSDIDKILSIQDRATQVDLSFYQSNNYLGTLGLGFYDNNKYFIKYRQSGKSKAAVISNEQKKKLLDLIGISEERFNSLYP